MAKKDSPINEALSEGLQQARKKARYFCVAAKNVDVVGMVVQRKPIQDAQLQKLKTETKGNALVQGVCTVNGTDLRLEILGAEPNITPKKIKEFVEAEADVTLRPLWTVVPQLTVVVDEEDDFLGKPTPPTRPTSAPPTPPTPAPSSTQERLKSLIVRSNGLMQTTPALRNKLLPVAQAASAAVTANAANAMAVLDKFEQALQLMERGSGPAPARPSQGPNVGSPPQPTPTTTAPGRPTAAPPAPPDQKTSSSSVPPHGGDRGSLFERAKHRLKNLGRDTEKELVFEEIRCAAALDSAAFAVQKLAQDVPGLRERLAVFSQQHLELQAKLQQLWNTPSVDSKQLGVVRKEAEELGRQVQNQEDETTACQQTLHEFRRRLQSAQQTVTVAFEEAKKEKNAAEQIATVNEYVPLLDPIQQSYDAAVKEFDATGDLKPQTYERLAAHDRDFTLFVKFHVGRVSLVRQVRGMELVKRAQSDPQSDAARLAAGFGEVSALAGFMKQVLEREQILGVDLRKMARPGEELTDEELVGLYNYTDMDYENINGLLLFPERFKNEPELAKRIQIKTDFCLRALSKLPEYPSLCYPVIRFESGDYDWQRIYVEGQTFRNKQFWSTGSTTGKFVKDPKKACLFFRIYGKTGKDVATFAMNSEGYTKSEIPQLKALSKGEVLFAPNTPFKVLAVAAAERNHMGLPTFNITLLEE